MSEKKKNKDPRRRGGRKPGLPDTRDLPPGEIPEREAKVLENRFIKKMTLADAAKDAGFQCESRAALSTAAGRVIQKHREHNSELMQALELKGINAGRIAGVIDDGLNATVAAKKGSEIVMVPDHSTRHKFVETTLDIVGGRAPKKVEVQNLTFEQRLMQITIEDNRE